MNMENKKHSQLVNDFQEFMRRRGYACFDEPPIYWWAIPDVVCLKRGYNKRITIVAEIKVSRSDFLSEIKKKKYLKSLNRCNKFYFVCPKDMIKPEEVPSPCGLYYKHQEGRMLRFVCVKNAKAIIKECLNDKEMWALLLSFETKLINERNKNRTLLKLKKDILARCQLEGNEIETLKEVKKILGGIK